MQSAFGILLFSVVGVSAVIGLLTFAGSRRAYDEIGKGLLSLRDDGGDADDGEEHSSEGRLHRPMGG